MNQNETIQFDRKIEVSLAEYTLLKEVHTISKRQAALLRVLEAEENFRKGKVSRVSFNSFLKSI